ncbi:MAG TPA: alpha-L-fucosidase, partial [Phycisphaerae bacterium]|nr:alpha-L-fucosidase [Phycisphaerae bacterium]
IHWGLYSLTGRGEWTFFLEREKAASYMKLADKFKPAKFDANAWAQAAVDAGMKYMVLTTRHHDGYCLWDSQCSDFTSVKTAARRDFVAEYVKACRKAGLKIGFYYSLLDWRFPGYWEPDKYPDSAKAMVQQAHDQVRELLTQYGKIDILWYDGGWLRNTFPPQIDLMIPFWRSKQLNAMARQLQPHILINNRSGTQEDFDTPEQHVTASEKGRGWESNMTIGDHVGWGYVKHNPNFKTVPQLLQYLVQAASGEGNYLLNVGPKPDGTIRKEELERLKKIGEWMRVNGEAIYNSERCDLEAVMLGLWTRKGKDAYLHVFRWPGKEAVIPLVKSKPREAVILQTGQKVEIRREYNGRLILSGMPEKPPHPYVTTIRIRFAEVPAKLPEPDLSAWLTGI